MALDAYVTPGELERQASLVFHGKPVKIWACNNQDDLQLTSKAQLWANKRLTDEIITTIGEGTYDAITGEFEVPPVVVRFESKESILRYDTICVWIDPDNSEYLHSVQVENPPVQMNPGSFRTYLIYFAQDDGPNFAVPIKFAMGFGEYYAWGGHVQFHKTFPEDTNVAVPGVYTLKGFSSRWAKEYPLNSTIAQPGSFGLSGTSVTFTAPIPHYRIYAQAGTILATGQDAVLDHLGDVDMAGETGEFQLDGQVIDMAKATTVTQDAGSFALTGQDAELSVPVVGSPGGRMYRYGYPSWYPEQGNDPPNIEEDTYPNYNGANMFCGEEPYPVHGLCVYPRDTDRVSMAEGENLQPGFTYVNKDVWITFRRNPQGLHHWKKYTATEMFLTDNDPSVGGNYIWMWLEDEQGGGITVQDLENDDTEQTDYTGVQDYRITFVEPAETLAPPPEWNHFAWNINEGGPERWVNEQRLPGDIASEPPGSCCYFQLGGMTDADGNDIPDKLIRDIMAGEVDLNGNNILDTPPEDNQFPWYNIEGMMSWDGGETWSWLMVNINMANLETGPAQQRADANGVWLSPLTPWPQVEPYGVVLPNGDQSTFETFMLSFPDYVPWGVSLKAEEPAPISSADRKRYEQWRKALPKKLRPSAMPKDPPREGSK